MRSRLFRFICCILGIVLTILFLFFITEALHFRQNVLRFLGPWGTPGVWVSDDHDLVIISQKNTENSLENSESLKMWILQDSEWLSCELLYDNSMTAGLFRTGVDVMGNKPFFTSRIRVGIEQIILQDPETSIGHEAEEWLHGRKRIVIQRKSKTVPDDSTLILNSLLSDLTK